MTSKEKTKLIDHLKNDIYCRIGISKISGVGVIAIRDIPKDTNPYHTLSKCTDSIIVLNDAELKGINKNVKKIIDDFFGNIDMSTGKKIKLYDMLSSGPNNINISFYMNHSDTPNISIKEDTANPYLEFITNRTIKEGEELTINYKEYEI